MADSTFWWLLTGAAVTIELLTGTFYLLMLGLGLMAAALTAHLGLSLTVQMAVAAVAGAGAVVVCHQWHKKHPSPLGGGEDSSMNLDVGATVQIDHWNPDGTALVRYRGTQWTAIYRSGTTPQAGMHRVAQLSGSRLLVEPL